MTHSQRMEQLKAAFTGEAHSLNAYRVVEAELQRLQVQLPDSSTPFEDELFLAACWNTGDHLLQTHVHVVRSNLATTKAQQKALESFHLLIDTRVAVAEAVRMKNKSPQGE